MMRVRVKLSTDGVWECRLYLGRTLTGKPRRRYRRFREAESEQQALELAQKWADSLTANGVVESTVIGDLLEDYVDIREKNGASPNSVRGWKLYTRYVRQYMPNANARELTTMDFNNLFRVLQTSKDDGGAGLSGSSALCVYNFLRAAYGFFCDSDICSTNPLINVMKPVPDRKEAAALASWDFAPLNERIELDLHSDMGTAEGYEAALFAFADWLALYMGLRVGEVCALRRRDFYTGKETYLHVCGTVIEPERGKPYRQNHTKGKKSRNVKISDDERAVIMRFITAQNAAIGNLSGTAPIITRDGSYMRPTTVSRRFKQMCKECGLPPDITFHSLRHTHASWLISEGYSIKSLAGRMGHAKPSTTLDEYGHLLPGGDDDAPAVLQVAKSRALGVPNVNQNDECGMSGGET